jgi:hypothetical protein
MVHFCSKSTHLNIIVCTLPSLSLSCVAVLACFFDDLVRLRQIRRHVHHLGSEFVLVYHDTAPAAVPLIAKSGLRMTAPTAALHGALGGGGVHFSTLGPCSYGLGGVEHASTGELHAYEDALVKGCFGVGRMREYKGTSKLAAVLVYALPACVLSLGRSGSDSDVLVSPALLADLSLQDGSPAKNYFLPAAAVVGAFLVDPRRPMRFSAASGPAARDEAAADLRSQARLHQAFLVLEANEDGAYDAASAVGSVSAHAALLQLASSGGGDGDGSDFEDESKEKAAKSGSSGGGADSKEEKAADALLFASKLRARQATATKAKKTAAAAEADHKTASINPATKMTKTASFAAELSRSGDGSVPAVAGKGELKEERAPPKKPYTPKKGPAAAAPAAAAASEHGVGVRESLDLLADSAAGLKVRGPSLSPPTSSSRSGSTARITGKAPATAEALMAGTLREPLARGTSLDGDAGAGADDAAGAGAAAAVADGVAGNGAAATGADGAAGAGAAAAGAASPEGGGNVSRARGVGSPSVARGSFFASFRSSGASQARPPTLAKGTVLRNVPVTKGGSDTAPYVVTKIDKSSGVVTLKPSEGAPADAKMRFVTVKEVAALFEAEQSALRQVMP